jgi:hypothetical protein
MLVTSRYGNSMRLLCTFVLACSLWVLPFAFGGDRAAAIFTCGMFDGKFQCKATQDGVVHGKNAIQGVDDPSRKGRTPEATTGEPLPAAPAGAQEVVEPGQHSCPPGHTVLAAPNASGSYCEPSAGTSEATNMGCQRGMVGTPPNCHCPKNSELLGGNCVHYTATCSNGLAADAPPQACAGVEEKLACKMRQDGLKDCCCLLYDKM